MNKIFDKYINELLFSKVFRYENDEILMLDKTPFMIFPARAMAKFVQTVSDEIGSERLCDIAYNAGEEVAEEFIHDFNWINKDMPGIMSMIKRMFEIMGFGKFDLKIWSPKEDKILVHVTTHPVIDWGVKLYGKNQAISPFYMAIYSAHLHKELGVKNCKMIETQRMSDGALFYEWSYNIFLDKQQKSPIKPK